MSSNAAICPGDDTPELQTLLRRLTDIGDRIERNRRNLDQLAREFSRVDSVIRAVTQSSQHGVPAEPQPPLDRSVPHMVLQVLSGAHHPLSAREVAAGILTLQALDINEGAQLKQMTHRVCVSLWVQNQKGLVRKIEISRARFRWELIRD